MTTEKSDVFVERRSVPRSADARLSDAPSHRSDLPWSLAPQGMQRVEAGWHSQRAIYLFHPSRLFRDCLKRSLKGAVDYAVRETADRDELDRDLQTSSIALLLVGAGNTATEIRMLDAILAQLGSTVPVVVTGDAEDPRFVASLLAKGVKGYVPASLDLEVTIQALRLVLAGGVFAPASCLLKLLESPKASPEKPTPPTTLTGKQLAVVEAIRKGKANKTIAYELNMCESTVKVHVRNIMKKLQAKNRTQVAYIATQLYSEGGENGSAPVK